VVYQQAHDKWRVFGNVTHEQSVRCTALAWYEPSVEDSINSDAGGGGVLRRPLEPVICAVHAVAMPDGASHGSGIAAASNGSTVHAQASSSASNSTGNGAAASNGAGATDDGDLPTHVAKHGHVLHNGQHLVRKRVRLERRKQHHDPLQRLDHPQQVHHSRIESSPTVATSDTGVTSVLATILGASPSRPAPMAQSPSGAAGLQRSDSKLSIPPAMPLMGLGAVNSEHSRSQSSSSAFTSTAASNQGTAPKTMYELLFYPAAHLSNRWLLAVLPLSAAVLAMVIAYTVYHDLRMHTSLYMMCAACVAALPAR